MGREIVYQCLPYLRASTLDFALHIPRKFHAGAYYKQYERRSWVQHLEAGRLRDILLRRLPIGQLPQVALRGAYPLEQARPLPRLVSAFGLPGPPWHHRRSCRDAYEVDHVTKVCLSRARTSQWGYRPRWGITTLALKGAYWLLRSSITSGHSNMSRCATDKFEHRRRVTAGKKPTNTSVQQIIHNTDRWAIRRKPESPNFDSGSTRHLKTHE